MVIAAKHLDQLGTAGVFLTALLSPCCFPLFAFAASLFGLGSFELFGGWTMWVFQVMVIISITGLYLSYRKHRFVYPLVVAITGGLLILYGYHIDESDRWTYFLYAGMAVLLGATFWNYRRNKIYGACAQDCCPTPVAGRPVQLDSIITCPACGHREKETMPTDACVFFYVCPQCHTRIKPKPGDCCVYCSYGTVKCPPIQAGADCC